MLIEKDTLPSVAMEFMNNTHEEDREIINTIFELILKYEKEPSNNNKENINVLQQKWFNHTVSHFHNEETEMKELGFPSYEAHKTEHEKVLIGMHEVFAQWQESSDISVLKVYFIDVLPKWVVNHIETMDIKTAKFIATKKSVTSTD